MPGDLVDDQHLILRGVVLTIENSRLLGLLGVGRRQSAGLATVEQARARFGEDTP